MTDLKILFADLEEIQMRWSTLRKEAHPMDPHWVSGVAYGTDITVRTLHMLAEMGDMDPETIRTTIDKLQIYWQKRASGYEYLRHSESAGSILDGVRIVKSCVDRHFSPSTLDSGDDHASA